MPTCVGDQAGLLRTSLLMMKQKIISFVWSDGAMEVVYAGFRNIFMSR